jgi:N-acetylglucosaminyldiphosphoundecaprenol N-acetyl-beta-D-mannosaminyltransferase
LNTIPIQILGYEIFCEIPDLNTEFQLIINTINPHSYCEAILDPQFKTALQDSNILLPDGIGIVFAAKLLSGEFIKKISGSDLHIHLLQKANKDGLRIFYLGSSKEVLIKIKNRISNEYPNCLIDYYSPPYKTNFNKEDNKEMISAINYFAPDILFVGMTAPKQEKWVYLNKSQINAKIICSIGAVFDFYSGNIKRPNQFWINLGLEWLIRFLKEPRRLFNRNFISTPLFLFYVLKTKLFLLLKSNTNAI